MTADDIEAARVVQSAIGADGEGRCKFDCTYCFASDPDYLPGEPVHSDEFMRTLLASEETVGVLMIGADTELLHDRRKAFDTIRRLAEVGKDITFATKMWLSRGSIAELAEIQDSLRRRGNILCIMVSIPLLSNSSVIEFGVAPVDRRMSMVRRLRIAGLLPFVGIRPLLPPDLLPDRDISEIVRRTVADSYGYIIGPYWFKSDRLGIVARDLPIFQRPVSWMKGHPVWNVYEDRSREQWVAGEITRLGGTLFERSSEAVIGIKRQVFTQPEDQHG